MVTEDTLEEAYRDNKDAELSEAIIESVEPVEQAAVLETVIPCTLEADYPLPVVDEEGNLTGRLSRGTLSDVLGERSQ